MGYFHPFIHKYIKERSNPHGVSPDFIYEGVKKSLENHRLIMDIHWSSASAASGVGCGAFAICYNHGWGFSEETKKLRQLFEEVVNFIPKEVDLNDYL